MLCFGPAQTAGTKPTSDIVLVKSNFATQKYRGENKVVNRIIFKFQDKFHKPI